VPFRRGDIVSLSRSQSLRLSATAPIVPNEPYSVGLPVNGAVKTFQISGQPGQSTLDVALALVAALVDQQTVYSVAVGLVAGDLVVVGALGFAYTAALTPNLTQDTIASAFLALEAGSGRPIGPIRVLESENTLERLREFWTRDRDGNLLPRNLIRGRELDTSNVLDFDATHVLTVLHREGF
jgi:hypothetical protein